MFYRYILYFQKYFHLTNTAPLTSVTVNYSQRAMCQWLRRTLSISNWRTVNQRRLTMVHVKRQRTNTRVNFLYLFLHSIYKYIENENF